MYRRARTLTNNSYYGQRAAEAESLLKRQKPSAQEYQGINFDDVSRTLDKLCLTETFIQDPPAPVTQLIERARQLVVADLPDFALEDLGSGKRRFPEDKAVSFVISRIHASKQDYYSVIVTLRRAFPNYDVRPRGISRRSLETVLSRPSLGGDFFTGEKAQSRPRLDPRSHPAGIGIQRRGALLC